MNEDDEYSKTQEELNPDYIRMDERMKLERRVLDAEAASRKAIQEAEDPAGSSGDGYDLNTASESGNNLADLSLPELTGQLTAMLQNNPDLRGLDEEHLHIAAASSDERDVSLAPRAQAILDRISAYQQVAGKKFEFPPKDKDLQSGQ